MKRTTRKIENKDENREYSFILEAVETETDLGYVEEGDIIDAEMIVEPEDIDLTELVGFAKEVCVDKKYDEENDEEYFDLRITVDDPESAQDLYDWIIDNGYAEDEEIETVAPGLEAYINGEDAVVADKEDDNENVEDVEDEPVEDDVDECANESVSKKFSKYRRLYEDEMEECGDACKDGKCDDKDLNEDDEESKDEGEDKSDDKEEDKEGDKEEQKEDTEDEETEDVPMTAVIISVKKGDEDKCKSEMIDAGISEDDIEILEADEDSDDVELKVDVNSIHELKSYLEGKGIDLEEKIGGEIVDDEEGEEGDEEGDEEKEGGDENLDDIDFGDLFSDDEEKEEEK